MASRKVIKISNNIDARYARGHTENGFLNVSAPIGQINQELDRDQNEFFTQPTGRNAMSSNLSNY